MIVERWTYQAKFRHKGELIELIKTFVERHGLTPRVWTYRYGGVFETVSLDLEFETEQDQQKYWAGIDMSQGEDAEAHEKLLDLIMPGITRELLTVH